MDAIDAIFQRQSFGHVKPDPVPREVIEQLLAAAVQSPNHHRVRPWRFYVLQGEARQKLGEVIAQSKQRENPDIPESVLQVERLKPLRAPVVIAVGVDEPQDPKVIKIENVCAAAAAVQNLLIAAQAFGLATFWRTGPAAYDPNVKAFLGLEPEQHLIAFVYLGYPEGVQPLKIRPSFHDRTVWLDD
jgi:nitroreductase